MFVNDRQYNAFVLETQTFEPIFSVFKLLSVSGLLSWVLWLIVKHRGLQNLNKKLGNNLQSLGSTKANIHLKSSHKAPLTVSKIHTLKDSQKSIRE